MTEELAKALESGAPPFHGRTCIVRNLSLTQLWTCYKLIQQLLLSRPTAELWQCADWHWHDGFITPPKGLTSTAWKSWTESPNSLAQAWAAEDYVHRGVYPNDLAWYLRFHLWEDLDMADFSLDISGTNELIEQLVEVIRHVQVPHLEVEDSDIWFLGSVHLAS